MSRSEQIQKYLSYATKTLFTILGLLMILSVVHIETNKKSPEEIAKILEESKEMRAIMAKGGQLNKNLPEIWPPKMNNVYPDFAMIDQEGREFLLSSLKGKVIIVEYIDISSPVSQAQSGARKFGAYYAASSSDIDEYAKPFAEVLKKNTSGSIVLPNDNIIELKIIIYGEGGGAGTRDDAQQWAQHFNLKKSDNVIVAVTKNDFRGKESDVIISGFQLLDKNMLLRVDSSGATPKHSLAMTLVPLVPKLIRN